MWCVCCTDGGGVLVVVVVVVVVVRGGACPVVGSGGVGLLIGMAYLRGGMLIRRRGDTAGGEDRWQGARGGQVETAGRVG